MTMTASSSSVRVVEGNLFGSDAQTLVNTVNTVGIMGKGVAAEFKKQFPDMYEDYRQRCARNEVALGRPYLYRTLFPPYVLNFPTKDHWKSVSRLQDIVAGLDYLEQNYEAWGITSLAVPPLGCGNGGLEWRVVGPELYRRLSRLDIPVTLYAPFGTPHAELTSEYLGRTPDEDGNETIGPQASKVPPSWIAIVAVLARLERNPHRFNHFVGRTIMQKLSYFATAAGLPTDLVFERGTYGPYTKQLKGVESKLVNNGLLRTIPSANAIAFSVGPTFEAASRGYSHQLEEWSLITASVASLLARMTTREAEVAATVHYVAGELSEQLGNPPSEQAVLEAVMEWKARKQPPLMERELAAAVRNLSLLGWLNAEPSGDLPVDDAAEAAFAAPDKRTRG